MDARMMALIGLGVILLFMGRATIFAWLGKAVNTAKNLKPAPTVAQPVQYSATTEHTHDGSVSDMVDHWEELKKAVEVGGAKEASAKLDEVFPLFVKKG